MTNLMHPQVSEVLEQAQRFASTLEDQQYWMDHESFRATDDARTVQVTINGRHWLTGLYIEDGLLRLGAATVRQRINEALHNAHAAATAAVEARQEQVIAGLTEIAGALQQMTGLAGEQ